MSEPQGVSPVQAEAFSGTLEVITEAVSEAKANGLLVLDLRELASFTDYLVICTGTSDRHVQAIVDVIRDRLKAAGESPLHTEGYEQAAWVLVDFVDFLVNVFTRDAREFYQLERVWRDAPVLIGERPDVPAEDAASKQEAAGEAGSETADAVDG